MDFNAKYDRKSYLDFLSTQLLPEDFKPTDEQIMPGFTMDRIQNIVQIGRCDSLELIIYEIRHKSENDPRVTLSRETFKLLAELGNPRALVLFVSKNSDNYRLSLVTVDLEWDEGSRVKKIYSNPRRYSFLLGPEAKIHTVQEYLIKPGRLKGFEDLKNRFSIEVVNKEFYTLIAMRFTDLVGGSRKIGSKKYEQKGSLVLPVGNDEQKRKEFAVRLIGRLVFCWFLKKKHSVAGVPLVPDDILSLKVAKGKSSYYHFVLEPLFFETLNKKKDDRHKKYKIDSWGTIPFLNGGLFTQHNDDHYTPDDFQGISPRGDVKVPDEWLHSLLEIFEIYNFTIDESTSVDVELSIDPEMLGRIFENLLAEINPETGETARKATGSYYTPRPIVDYMVDQSLKQYLLTQTQLPENKIDSLLDYAKEAAEAKLTDNQVEIITDVLHKIKVLDPACGSGAFPMGILQKILLILQKVDPDSRKWKKLILAGISDPTARNVLSNKFKSETWQYIHKLGVIQNSIYGVDIQPIAAEISKLRVFLSLIVDETVNDDKDNRGIEPLPNLKFKFVCGNSLIDKFMGRIIKTGSSVQTESKRIIDKLTGLKADFFSAEKEEGKVGYNLKILQCKLELAEQLLADLRDTSKFTDNLFGSEAQTKKEKKEKKEAIIKQCQAKSLNKAIENTKIDINKLIAKPQVELTEVEQLETKHFKESFIWKMDFAEIFAEKNGFDIVISNPPYVGEKGHKEMFREIKKGNLSNYYQGKMDLFYFFFHLALNLGKQNSNIAFITTNYYPTATGANKLRQDFKKRSILKYLINFNELRIFESALGQHNMITILEKSHNEEAIAKTCISKQHGIATAEALQRIVIGSDLETQYYSGKQEDLYDGPEYYIRLTKGSETSGDPIQGILGNMKRQGSTLGIMCNVNTGIMGGCDYISKRNINYCSIHERTQKEINLGDGVFVLDDQNEVDERVINKIKHSGYLHRFYKNSDIKRYRTNNKTSKHIIFSAKDNIAYDNLDIKNHLNKFKCILEKNRSINNENIEHFPFLRRGTAHQHIFKSPKIVAPQRSTRNTFGYNEVPWYASADVYFITEKDKSVFLKYVLALLNSKLYYQWLYHRGKRKGETLELYQKPLSEIPIKIISKTEQEAFISIVDKILTKKENGEDTTAEEARIDIMVYKLYGLTKEESAIVENSGS
jgi:adenine-specific DNA-methyltransferase